MSAAEVRAAAVIGAATLAVIAAAVPLVRRADASRFAVEPSIAEAANGTVAVAWMSGGGGPADRIALRVGGASREARSPGGRYAADPVLVARGDAFDLVWLGFRQNVAKRGPPYDVRVYAARALGAPVEVAGGEGGETYDRPSAAATADGALRVVFRVEAPAASGIALATSADGRGFARAWVASGAAFGGSLPQICASRDGGRVYVTYVDPAAGVIVRASDDGGARFLDARAAVLAPADAALAFEGAPCVADGDEVAVAFGRAVRPIRSDASAVLDAIAVVRSRDGGATFDAPELVREEGLVLMHPAIAREPSGALVVAYYAGRAEGDRSATFRARRLGAGSAILSGPLLFAPSRADPAWPGDYAGAAAGPSGTFAAFVAADPSGARRVEVARVP